MLEKGDENVTSEVWAQGPPCRKTEMGEFSTDPKVRDMENWEKTAVSSQKPYIPQFKGSIV